METENALLGILYLSIFVSLLGLIVFVSANFLGSNGPSSSGGVAQKIKITIPENAPAALSGKWKLIK